MSNRRRQPAAQDPVETQEPAEKGHIRRHKRVRRAQHRQRLVRGLLVGAMVLGTQAKPKATHRVKDGLMIAEVRVSMGSFAAVPMHLAYDDIIDEAARATGVDADLIHAVIETESRFNARAESPGGAQGLMQLMPALQEELGVLDPFDPRQNVLAGARYLKRLLQRHGGNVALALASYNAGPGNVTKYKGMPPFQETRNYVRKIKAILANSAAE